MIFKTDLRILKMMAEKCERLIEIQTHHTVEELQTNYIYSDAIQYEFEKLYEDSTRLSAEFNMYQDELHIFDLRGIRNRVAHNYESVSLQILIDTIANDIPNLLKKLESLIKDNE